MNKLHQDVIDSQIRRYIEELESFRSQVKTDKQIPDQARDEICIDVDRAISILVYAQFKNNPSWLCDTPR